MNKFVLAKSNLCISCRTCEIACALAHSDKFFDDMAPEDFEARVSVVKFDDVSAALTCRHCEYAPCAAACPNGAIEQQQDSIQVSQDKCIGCRNCVLACPSGAISVKVKKVPRIMDERVVGYNYKATAQKCDLCASSPTGSACVAICPTKALSLVNS
jgi:electron transport protein HydN